MLKFCMLVILCSGGGVGDWGGGGEGVGGGEGTSKELIHVTHFEVLYVGDPMQPAGSKQRVNSCDSWWKLCMLVILCREQGAGGRGQQAKS